MKLSIKNFQQGQTSSPYTQDGAFWKSANLDIHGQEGIARINYKPTGIEGTSPNHMQGIITSFASLFGTGGALVFADQGKPVKIWNGTAVTAASIANVGAAALNSMYVTAWKGKVLSINTTTLSAMSISAAMDGAWTSLSSSFENMTLHKILNSVADGKIYIANDNKIARLSEVTGKTFDQTDSTTYAITLDALKLPLGYRVESMEDFGRFIAVFVSIHSQARTLILLWDRVSSNTADAVYEINEDKMTRTLERHGTIYISGGTQGNIYKLSESGLSIYAKINVGDYDNRQLVYSGLPTSFQTTNVASMAWWKDKLMIAITTDNITPSGIYSVKNGRVNHEFIPSNGSIADEDVNKFGAMTVWGDYLLYGYRDATKYYLDVVLDSNNRLETGCYLETPLMRAGYKMQKGSVDRIEVILARPLQTGESFTFKYRRALTESYTTLATKSFTTDGAQSTFVLDGIKNIDNLQLRIDLGTGASSKNTPMISEVALF